MDEADRAQEVEDADREASLAKARGKAGLAPCGYCYNCAEPLVKGRLFCDADCRDDYDLRQRMKREQPK